MNHAESVAKAKGSSAETIRGGMSAVDLRKTLYRNGRHDERDRDDAHEKQDLVQFVEQVARNAYP